MRHLDAVDFHRDSVWRNVVFARGCSRAFCDEEKEISTLIIIESVL